MGKSIREVYGTVLAELGDTNENIVVLDADLSGSTKSGIAPFYSDKYAKIGIQVCDLFHEDRLMERLDVVSSFISPVSPALAIHTGPGLLGAIVQLAE